jgi:hypothetical protein
MAALSRTSLQLPLGSNDETAAALLDARLNNCGSLQSMEAIAPPPGRQPGALQQPL